MEKQYPESATRRAVKESEVILKAMAGEIKWIQAADILGITPRAIRNKHYRYREYGVAGLLDRRKGSPSPRKAPFEVVQTVLRRYRKEFRDFNVKHFHERMVEEEGLQYGYTWTKNLLQEAGYVKRAKKRGGHRKRRERRPLFGQMLHLDGSEHEWLSLRPGERQMLLLVVDDATGRNLSGCLVESETTWTCLDSMRSVVEEFGIPAQLYTDRDSVYWHTKTAGEVDRERLTQFGRAMAQLGVEMIPAYSPQARGRSERWNGTWQGRLVPELRRAGIDNSEDANRYIQEVFLPDMNRRFAVTPKEEGSAFVSADGADLDRIFSIRREGRAVAKDNTARVNGFVLQLEKSPFRTTFAGCRVDVLEHRDGAYTILWNGRVVGRYDAQGKNVDRGAMDLGLSLSGPKKQGKRRKSKASAASPVTLRALGSLPSVALSSRKAKPEYRKNS